MLGNVDMLEEEADVMRSLADVLQKETFEEILKSMRPHRLRFYLSGHEPGEIIQGEVAYNDFLGELAALLPSDSVQHGFLEDHRRLHDELVLEVYRAAYPTMFDEGALKSSRSPGTRYQD